MWLVGNPVGILCAGFFYVLVLYVCTVTFILGVLPLHEISSASVPGLALPYLLTFCFSVLMHAKCVLTDPGTITLNSATAEEAALSRACQKCKCVKRNRAHHCSVCQRCVMRMDHHCPWINNCVGLVTQKHFLLFLFYTLLASLFSISLLCTRAVTCLSSSHKSHDLCDTHRPEFRLEMVLGVSAFMISSVFSVFLLFMLCDQLCKVVRGTTGIEQLQQVLMPNVRRRQRPTKENLYEVCGGELSVKWFLPISVERPKEETLLVERGI